MQRRCVRPVPPHAPAHALAWCRHARRHALGRRVVEVVDEVLLRVVRSPVLDVVDQLVELVIVDVTVVEEVVVVVVTDVASFKYRASANWAPPRVLAVHPAAMIFPSPWSVTA